MDKKFASRFAEALNHSGLKQSDLAKRLGVNRSSISRYRSGDCVPEDFEFIRRMAEELGVSPAWLSGMEEKKENEPICKKGMTRNKIDRRLDSLDEKDLSKVLLFIDEFLLDDKK